MILTTNDILWKNISPWSDPVIPLTGNCFSNHMQKSWMNWESSDQSHSGQSVVPWTSSISNNWEFIRNINWHITPRPTESGALRVGPSNLCFKKPSRWFWHTCKFENHWPNGSTGETSWLPLCFGRAVIQRRDNLVLTISYCVHLPSSEEW